MPAPVRTDVTARSQHGAKLPRWPLTVSFVAFPVWWLLGLGESAWAVTALIMALYLARRGGVRVPRWFGIWLLFLLWMLVSGIGIDSPGRMLGFVYRAIRYLGATVFLVYVYNSRTSITARYVAGVCTAFWLIVTCGGYIGLLFPLFEVKTILAYVMPGPLANNELIHEMIYRRVTQVDADQIGLTSPRPSAPFVYTNGWGNAYSLLLPVVIAYLTYVRGERRFWLVLVAIPVSAIPALLTLNRGMGIGLAVALVYASLRLAFMGRVRAVASLMGVAGALVVVGTQLPVADFLLDRLQTSSTTADRFSLYVETFRRTLDSPLLGYGAPRPSRQEGLPSVGTQGQVWMLMFSHGFPAVALYFGWLLMTFRETFAKRSPMGLASSTTVLVLMVESLYYGVVPVGLTIVMISAAVVLRPSGVDEPMTTSASVAETSSRPPDGRGTALQPAFRKRANTRSAVQ